MWTPLTIEKITKKKLKEKFNAKGEGLYRDYESVKLKLCDNVLDELKGKLPDFTDHGAKHIEHVLTNAESLLGDSIEDVRGLDLYCLLMSILFHDTGNFFDRDDHQKRIEELYCYARPSNSDFRLEQFLITKMVKAHCGISPDKTRDTLQYVDDRLPHDISNFVNCRELSALLRFADELAEGKQRTSSFRIENDDYSKESLIYHQYAKVTSIAIDRKNGRIALTYSINVDKFSTAKGLKALLSFIYSRIIKLDQERRYNKHYCDWLSPFKQTSVSFNFYAGPNLLELGLNSLSLTDLTIPGEKNKKIEEHDSDYKISDLVKKIRGIQKKKK